MFREANFTADALAKHSHMLTAPMLYFVPNQLPPKAKELYDLDKIEMPSFRRKRLKRIKKPP